MKPSRLVKARQDAYTATYSMLSSFGLICPTDGLQQFNSIALVFKIPEHGEPKSVRLW